MKCPKCQSENPEKAKFCIECGNQMEFHCPKCGEKLLQICPKCGAENLPGDNFCDQCGHNLEEPQKAFSGGFSESH